MLFPEKKIKEERELIIYSIYKSVLILERGFLAFGGGTEMR